MPLPQNQIKANDADEIDPKKIPVIPKPQIIEYGEVEVDVPVPPIPADILKKLGDENRESLLRIFGGEKPTKKPN